MSSTYVSAIAVVLGSGGNLAGVVSLVQGRQTRRENEIRWKLDQQMISKRWITSERLGLYRHFIFVSDRAHEVLHSVSWGNDPLTAHDGTTIENIMEGLSQRSAEVDYICDDRENEEHCCTRGAARDWVDYLQESYAAFLRDGRDHTSLEEHRELRQRFIDMARDEVMTNVFSGEILVPTKADQN